MQVVQVYDVRFVQFQLADEPTGGPTAEKSGTVQQPRTYPVQPFIHPVADPVAGHGARGSAAGIAKQRPVAHLLQRFADAHSHVARAEA